MKKRKILNCLGVVALFSSRLALVSCTSEPETKADVNVSSVALCNTSANNYNVMTAASTDNKYMFDMYIQTEYITHSEETRKSLSGNCCDEIFQLEKQGFKDFLIGDENKNFGYVCFNNILSNYETTGNLGPNAYYEIYFWEDSYNSQYNSYFGSSYSTLKNTFIQELKNNNHLYARVSLANYELGEGSIPLSRVKFNPNFDYYVPVSFIEPYIGVFEDNNSSYVRDDYNFLHGILFTNNESEVIVENDDLKEEEPPINNDVTESIYPEYDFPESCNGVRFNSIKLEDKFIYSSETHYQDYDYYAEEVGNILMGYSRCINSEYVKEIKLRGTYTNTEYTIIYNVINAEGSGYDGNEFRIELRKGNESIILLRIVADSSKDMEYWYQTISEEYIFKESMFITENGSWKAYEYNDAGYLVNNGLASSTDLEYIDCAYLKAVDYGDLLAPDLSVEANIVSDITNPLSLNQIKSQITAIDDVDGNISSRVEISSTTYNPNKLTVGKHVFTAKVSDSAGNESSITFNVFVYDITKPIITGVNNYSISYDEELSVDDIKANLSVSDNYDTSLELTIVNDKYSSNLNKVGNHSITFKTTDKSGNDSEEFVVNIEIYDHKSPIITAPSVIECSNVTLLSLDKIKSVISVVDGYDTKTTYEISNYDYYKARYKSVGNYTLQIKATDSSGNIANHTITLKVEDGTSPTLFLPKNYIITLNKGQILTNDMILNFLSQVGEVKLSNVSFVESEYQAINGDYEVLVFMKDESIYKTSIKVSDGTETPGTATEDESKTPGAAPSTDEKLSFWESFINWFKKLWDNIVNWFNNLFGGNKTDEKEDVVATTIINKKERKY